MIRRALVLVARALLVVVLTAVLAEMLLQGAALFARRRDESRPGGLRRLVAVGDSHTYGAMVAPEDSYPGQLQHLLDAQAPGAWSVVNLGVPGMNTSEVRAQLQRALAEHRVDLAIVWCGVNNAWNQAGGSVDSWWAAAARRLRLVRLFRVWLHDRRLDAAVAAHPPGAVPERTVVSQNKIAASGSAIVRRMERDGVIEEVVLENRGMRVDAAMEERAEADYRGMIADARAAGVPIVFVAYPYDEDAFAAANRAMRRATDAEGVALVDTTSAVLRVPPERRKFLWGAHPNEPMYTEIARELLPVVLAGGKAPPQNAGLGRIDFEGAWGPDASGRNPVRGPCERVDVGCARGGRCYRWNPRAAVCSVRTDLRRQRGRVRLSARLRMDVAPQDAGGRDVLSLQEEAYGTGVALELESDARLRLLLLPGKVVCGPLRTPLDPGTWYTVRVEAEKAENATATLELLADDGRVLDSATCTGSTGGGAFSVAVLGNDNPYGTTADVTFDDVSIVPAS
jgi:lysophospholipase L1-like esterase